ncbi:hypothetical protein [Sphingomonas sp.]|uniref:hypothetical protein n=1 Tax=Sphingomonas sp. TaxID=28214 RepID=UPI003D6C8530
MPKKTVGEELQTLFRLHDQGRIAPDEFQYRKGLLLKCTECELSAFLPDPGAATRRAAVATAGVVLLAIIMIVLGHKL